MNNNRFEGLLDIARECYDIAAEHGFWNDKILPICKEINEKMVERFLSVANDISKMRGDKTDLVLPEYKSDYREWITIKTLLIVTELGELLCAESEEEKTEELADVFIRLMDLIFYYDSISRCGFIDILQKKMEKNRSRPFLHNKKC